MKTSKGVIIRLTIFAFLLLVVIPLWFSTFLDIHYVWGIRASFFFLKIFKLAIISSILLCFIIWVRIKKFPALTFNLKQTLFFGLLAIVFFYFAFSTQNSLTEIVSGGMDINYDKINFDGGRWLALSVLGDTGGAFYDAVITGSDESFKKQIYLSSVTEDTTIIKFYSSWTDTNDNNNLDSKVILLVNNKSFDMTNKYKLLKSEKGSWFELSIMNDYLVVGLNDFIIYKNSSEDAITMISQDIYQESNSFISRNNMISWDLNGREFIWTIREQMNFFDKILFKLGFLFKILGIISLFIAVFGLSFVKSLVKTSYIELLFSTIFAYWVYGFSEFIKTKWAIFSGAVAKSLFFLFKISGLNPSSFINREGIQVIGINGFLAGIYDVCSGVDSMGLFTLAYFMLIVFFWKKITFWKAFLMYIPGIIGVFCINILRVYLLILIGAKISVDFAINAFHTNAGMVLTIIYFLVFFPFVLKVIEKKKK